MIALACESCMGNEFKHHKFGLQCKYCGTIYETEHKVTQPIFASSSRNINYENMSGSFCYSPSAMYLVKR